MSIFSTSTSYIGARGKYTDSRLGTSTPPPESATNPTSSHCTSPSFLHNSVHKPATTLADTHHVASGKNDTYSTDSHHTYPSNLPRKTMGFVAVAEGDGGRSVQGTARSVGAAIVDGKGKRVVSQSGVLSGPNDEIQRINMIEKVASQLIPSSPPRPARVTVQDRQSESSAEDSDNSSFSATGLDASLAKALNHAGFSTKQGLQRTTGRVSTAKANFELSAAASSEPPAPPLPTRRPLASHRNSQFDGLVHRPGPVLRDASRSPVRINVNEVNASLLQPSNAQIETASSQDWFSSSTLASSAFLGAFSRSVDAASSASPLKSTVSTAPSPALSRTVRSGSVGGSGVVPVSPGRCSNHALHGGHHGPLASGPSRRIGLPASGASSPLSGSNKSVPLNITATVPTTCTAGSPSPSALFSLRPSRLPQTPSSPTLPSAKSFLTSSDGFAIPPIQKQAFSARQGLPQQPSQQQGQQTAQQKNQYKNEDTPREANTPSQELQNRGASLSALSHSFASCASYRPSHLDLRQSASSLAASSPTAPSTSVATTFASTAAASTLATTATTSTAAPAFDVANSTPSTSSNSYTSSSLSHSQPYPPNSESTAPPSQSVHNISSPPHSLSSIDSSDSSFHTASESSSSQVTGQTAATFNAVNTVATTTKSLQNPQTLGAKESAAVCGSAIPATTLHSDPTTPKITTLLAEEPHSTTEIATSSTTTSVDQNPQPQSLSTQSPPTAPLCAPVITVSSPSVASLYADLSAGLSPITKSTTPIDVLSESEQSSTAGSSCSLEGTPSSHTDSSRDDYTTSAASDTLSESDHQSTSKDSLNRSPNPSLSLDPPLPLSVRRRRTESSLHTLFSATFGKKKKKKNMEVEAQPAATLPISPVTAVAPGGPLSSQTSNLKSVESSAASVSSVSASPNEAEAPDASVNGSSTSSQEAGPEPEPVAGFSYHHNPYPNRTDLRGGSTPNLLSDSATPPPPRRHLTPSMQNRLSMARPASTYSLASEYRGRGTNSPHLRNPSASSRRSPDVRPQSYIDMLNTPYPQPAPAPISFDNTHLKHSVGTNASLLGTEKTLEMYRNNVKKTNDLSIQYSFAVFLISSAQEQALAVSEGQAEAQEGKNSGHELIREAKSILQKLSSSGYPFAQYYLADGYASGLFSKGKEDYSQAFPLFAMAAKHGHAESAYRTALCYEHGWGTRKDPAKALNFLRVAATKKHPGAMTRLGVSCLSGDLGERKYREGIKWLKLASESADAIYPAAPFILGCLYENGDGEDIFQDPGYAAELFTQAAELGHADASFRMGDAYEHGKLNCPKNPALSVHFYTGAAEKGNAAAMMGLCAWYIVGADPILEKDEEEAYEWAKRAADMGYTKAQYAVGYFTEMGIGCHRDILEANVWYVKAAEQGDERAKVRISVIDAAIRGEPIDIESARSGTDGSGGKIKKGGAPGKKDGECVVM